ncbi:hypothetical protein B0H34DRAFT_711425 [Crassisporium funariophilum]|nr:hypothetical protein B0H34DRAFT_711425 [Crassisporium funariophilum]
MPPKAFQDKAKIPAITWTTDLVWKIINAAQENENKNVMIGKAKEDNTTADSKVAVFKRVAQAVIPDIFKIDGDMAGKRTQSKWDSLKKAYRFHAGKLIQTGGGVRDEPDGVAAENTHHEYSDCYIPANGPDESTTDRARNLWDQINEEFPFFPVLHRLLCTRPNFNPPAVTTGVGPQGQRTVHYQAPATTQRAPTPVIDPALEGLTFPPHVQVPLGILNAANAQPPAEHDAPALPPVPWQPTEAGNKENPTKTPVKHPKASIFGSAQLDSAFKKAQATIKPLSSKRRAPVEDAFVKMSRETLKLTQARYKEEVVYKRRKLDIEERTLLLAEKNAGAITQEDYDAERKLIGKVRNNRSPSVEHQVNQVIERNKSPEWDYGRLNIEMDAGDNKDDFYGSSE